MYNEKTPMEPVSYTIFEAAEKLGIDPAVLRVYLNRRVVRGFKRGRDWFISHDELTRYMAESDTKKETPKQP